MKKYFPLILLLIAVMAFAACSNLPELPTRTPEAEVAGETPPEQAEEPAPASAAETESAPPAVVSEPEPERISARSAAGAAAKAVDLIGAWVEGGAPETEPFDYEGADGHMHQGTFEADILPLFTTNGLWFDGAQACTGCHFANSEASYHEMNLSSYEGIMLGGDVLSQPPGVPLLGNSAVGETDYDWAHSKLRGRLRNNRMPPGWEFDITEENRDGPTIMAGIAK